MARRRFTIYPEVTNSQTLFPRFYYVDFKLVTDHIPRLRDLSAEDLGKAVEQNRESVHPSKYKPPFLDHVLPYIPNSEYLNQ